MKIIKETPVDDGKRTRITLEIGKHETLIAVNDDAHYQLGYPLEDVVSGNIVSQMKEVSWCSIEQKWKE